MLRTHLVGLMLIPTLMLGLNNAYSQPPQTDAGSKSEIPSFLKPPPKELLRRGLQPLSTELPDTRTREGLMPPDASAGLFGLTEIDPQPDRGLEWTRIRYHWAASGNRYRPLYFEDAMLERHGQARHPLVQPLASGTRFFLTCPALPYAALVNPPRPATSALGHFRPGDGTPLLLQRPPLQADAGLFEAGMVVGLIFIIP